jgi:hypothetical protein
MFIFYMYRYDYLIKEDHDERRERLRLEQKLYKNKIEIEFKENIKVIYNGLGNEARKTQRI